MSSTLYLFLHAPDDETTAPDVYAGRLIRFHEELEEALSPSGWYRGSAVFRHLAPPNAQTPEPTYSDWYLLDGAARLEDLNAAAVTGAPGEAHSDLVGLTHPMSIGGVYQFYVGADQLPVAANVSYWFEKPAALSSEELQQALESLLPEGASAWRRFMALGPHGLIVTSPADVELPDEWNAARLEMTRI